MFWKKNNNNNKVTSRNLKCKAIGCDFACDDYLNLQKHTYKKHPGFKLTCEMTGCDFTCDDYRTLDRHISWKHKEKVT
jgi:hypothetical protein